MDVQLRETTVELPLQSIGASEIPALFGPGPSAFPHATRLGIGAPVRVGCRAVELENDYLKLTVLPELGGRVACLYDKLAGRDLLLPVRETGLGPGCGSVALAGRGLSFCFHSVASGAAQEPVNCLTRRYSDGSASVVLGGIEAESLLRWAVELKLHPEKAALEQTVELLNLSAERRSFLWQNEAAVPRARGMSMVFPFDWRTVPGGKTEKWPVDGPLDSSDPGALPDGYETSGRLMSDCFGVYYPDWDFGLAHFASRMDVSGAGFAVKSGEAVLLRCGPAGGSLPPHGALRWAEVWFGVRGIGRFRSASRGAAVAVERSHGCAVVRLCANGRYDEAAVRVSCGGKRLERAVSLSPESPSAAEFTGLSPEEALTVDVLCRGRILATVGREPQPCDEPPREEPSPAPQPSARYASALEAKASGDDELARGLFLRVPMGDPLFGAARLEAALLNFRLGDPAANGALLEGCEHPLGCFLRAASLRTSGLQEGGCDSCELEECFLAERYLKLGDSAFSSFTGNREDPVVCIALLYAALGLTQDCLKLLGLVEKTGMKTALAKACCGAMPMSEALALPIAGVFVSEPRLLEALGRCGDSTGRAQWLLGSSRYARGLREEALALWLEAYGQGLRLPAMLYCLGRALWEAGSAGEACGYLRLAAGQPGEAGEASLALLLRVLREQGELLERGELLSRPVQPPDSPAVAVERAAWLVEAGKAEDALSLLEKTRFPGELADAAAEGWSSAAGSLALRLAREGAFELARAAADRMFHYPTGLAGARLASGRARHLLTLGQVYRLTDHPQKSREAFRQGAMESARADLKEDAQALRWARLCQDELRSL